MVSVLVLTEVWRRSVYYFVSSGVSLVSASMLLIVCMPYQTRMAVVMPIHCGGQKVCSQNTAYSTTQQQAYRVHCDLLPFLLRPTDFLVLLSFTRLGSTTSLTSTSAFAPPSIVSPAAPWLVF